jgi:regulator of sirC expression with transglutaminase-like and TPR domain
MSAASRERFRQLLLESHPDLAELNLLIAVEAYPKLDVARWLGRVQQLADDATRHGGGVEGVLQALRAAGLEGDRTTYDDPRNSFLHEVLDRRVGLPITLSVLTVAVAERIGVPVAPVGLPGHFIVAELTDGTPRFLDPFHDWQQLSTEECARIVRSLEGSPLVASHLAPTPPGPVVQRMLANLTRSYLLRESLTDALWTVELALIVTPDDVELAAQREAILRAIDGAGAEPA